MHKVVGPPVTGLTVVEVDGCFHIYNPATHRAAALNTTASQIWRLSTGDLTAEEMVQTLAEHYGTDIAAIEVDVLRVVHDLSREGLFVPATAI